MFPRGSLFSLSPTLSTTFCKDRGPEKVASSPRGGDVMGGDAGYAGRAVHPPRKAGKVTEGSVLPTDSPSFSEMAGLFLPSSACCITGSLKEILKDQF